MKASTRRTIFIVAAIALVILVIVLAYTLTAPKEIGYSGIVEGDSTLESLVKEGKVQALRVSGSYSVDILLVGEKRVRFYANIPARSVLAEDVEKWAEQVVESDADLADKIITMPIEPSRGSLLSSLLVPIILYAILFIVFMIILRKSAGVNNQAMNFGKTTANQVRDIKVRFSDVAGADEEKQELQATGLFSSARPPARAKRCSRKLSRARRTCLSFPSAVRTLSRCSLAWARPECAICLTKPKRICPASSLSTRSTPSADSAARDWAAETTSASRL